MFPHFDRTHAAVSALREKQFFFVGGTPKSGTTWLQLLLDAHPAVSCSGEGHFADELWPLLHNALQRHDQVIATNNNEVFDEVKPYARLSKEDVAYVMAVCVAVFLVKQSRGKGARALGDKTPANIRSIFGLAALVPTAKFIQIVRDGRDCTISGWFHNLRNPAWATLNGGSLEALSRKFANMWTDDLIVAQQFADRHPDRFCRIRYEDLASDTEDTLALLFEFLGVDAGAAVLAQCREAASFARYSRGRDPGEENRSSLFRKGVTGDWRNHFSEEADAIFRERAGAWLDRLGYS